MELARTSVAPLSCRAVPESPPGDEQRVEHTELGRWTEKRSPPGVLRRTGRDGVVVVRGTIFGLCSELVENLQDK